MEVCIMEVCDICVLPTYVDTSETFSTNLLMLMFVVLIFEVWQLAPPMVIVRMFVESKFVVSMFAIRIFAEGYL